MQSWKELEVLLDIEATLNNCPLSYVENDGNLQKFKPRRQVGTVAQENIRLIAEQEEEDY